MNNDPIELKLFTTIKTPLLQKSLWRGTLYGALGASLFFISGIWAPVAFLTKWGWAVVLIALSLIFYGLYPYKVLMKKDSIPDVLFVDGQGILRYWFQGKIVLTAPIDTVRQVDYYEEGDRYGMLLELEAQPVRKLPYFNDRACATLKEYLSNSE